MYRSIEQHASFESLETRRLMAAFPVNGTPGDDIFHVDVVNAGDTLTIDGKGGNDTVYFGASAHTMQNIVGNVVLKNPTGSVYIIMDDDNDTAARHAYITPTGITGLAPGNISFESDDFFSIQGGKNNDVFTINGTGVGASMGGGVGNDTYEINQHYSTALLTIFDGHGRNEYLIAESTESLDNVTGPVSITDGGEFSAAVMYDGQAGAGHTYWLTKFTDPYANPSIRLTRSGSPTNVELRGVDGVSLQTSGFDDVVYLTDPTAQLPYVSVNTGEGNDTIYGNNESGDTINGGNGNDTATIDVYDGECLGVETVKYPASSGSISGSVFNDLDGDGVKDAGESGLAGIQVYLDKNDDRAWDGEFEPVRVTDANGNWNFSGVPSGKEFIARMYLTNTPYVQTLPAANTGIHVTLSSGQNVTGRQFGARVPPPASGSISGKLFHDLDGDGTRDAAEPYLIGRKVWLDTDNDKVLDGNEKYTTTNSSGYYAFTALAAGTYKVRQVLPSGWVQTTPANGSGIGVTLAAGQAAEWKFFGSRKSGAAIAGTVFNDLDGDGTRDGGDGGLSGRTIWLDLDNDKVLDAAEPTTVTDVNGNYAFAGLSAGTYKLRQQLPSGWRQTTPSSGAGIGVTVSTSQLVTGKLFGEQKI